MPSPTYNIGITDDGMEKIWAKVADGSPGAGGIEFMGKAHPGTATSSPLWQIQKWSYDAAGFLTNIKFASGKADFTFIWDARAGLF